MNPSQTLIDQLNWNLLRTFYMIAEEGSLTRAADRLSVSQPSVSAALQKLEESLGCQLIERDSRRFDLTDQGELLLGECSVIFESVNRIGQKMSDLEDQLSGVLHLQMITSLQSPIIDEVIRLMHLRHPAVTFLIDVASSREIVRAVSRKQVPFGICLLMEPVKGVDCKLLFREEFGIYCGQEHPLFGSDINSLKPLRDEGFVSFTCSEEGGFLEPMNALRDGAGLGRRVVGASAQLDEVRRMIIAGVGIGIMPVASVTRAVAAGLLWRLPVIDTELGANVFLVSNPDRTPDRVSEAFRSVLELVLESGV